MVCVVYGSNEEVKDLTKRPFNLGGSISDVNRKGTVWYFVLAPITLLYLLVVFKVALSARPISRLMGLPANFAEAILLDICVLVLPLVAAIFAYLHWRTAQQRLVREAFMREFEARDLVASAFNRNLIYVVLERGPEGTILKAQAVWTADGRCSEPKIYEDIDAASVTAFDAKQFAEG